MTIITLPPEENLEALMSFPPLNTETIRGRLNASILGGHIYFFESTLSTQDEARALIRARAPAGTIVLANEQTGGRGRFGRSWVSPKGQGLHMSLILYPDLRILSYLGIVAGVAVARALRELTSLKISAKWPNDIMVNQRKVAGILIESELGGQTVHFSILGIGVNVNLDTQDCPLLAGVATSLAMETAQKWDRLDVLTSVLYHLEFLYLDLVYGRVPLEEWRGLLETLGRYVTVRSGADVFRGFARDIDQAGNLVLVLPDGSELSLLAGDVTLQEPI